MTSVRLTDGAEADFLQIVDELSNVSFDGAHRLVDGIEAAWTQLAEFPALGHRHQSLPDRLRVLAVDRWLIVYEAGPAPVLVIGVVDASRDLRRLYS